MQKSKLEFIQNLRSNFPALADQPLEQLVNENLISPFTIRLPSSLLLQAQSAISALFSMRERDSYKDHYQTLISSKGIKDPGNKSIMMSYDFHVSENNNLKLIEINTNAAFLILGYQLYQLRKQKLPVSDFSLSEIAADVQNELRLQGKNPPAELKMSIIDDKPEEQRLYVEFLVYKEFFKSLGWDCRIQDYHELFQDFNPDFIYNRFTDFFLTEPESSLLRQKFLSKDICLSPNPYEYLLLADKQRLIDWVQPGFLESQGVTDEALVLLKTILPMSHDLNQVNAEEIWSQRKKLFFKPKNAFGSKQSFRGSSISRKAFEELLKDETIAQEFIPAPEQTFETPEGPQSFKFDLRCYAYRGRLQLIVARLYQGQVTNLRTPYGGFAPVEFF
ncbi:MAG: hypothetical protein ACXVCY_09700 [Pseudobdellovibrionaceae bacterium]